MHIQKYGPERLEKCAAALCSDNLDALLLIPGASQFYLTGLSFHLMERPVMAFFFPDSKPLLILPELEIGKTLGLEDRVDLFFYGENPQERLKAIQNVIRQKLPEKAVLGVEPLSFRYLEHAIVIGALPQGSLVNAENIIIQLRSSKATDEVEAMRAAARIAEQALEATIPMIRPGVKETEIASELTAQLFRHGSEIDLPFFPIVSGGPDQSADPHATPSERPLQEGDLLVIDWGARYLGYASDITRTFGIGSLSDELQNIHLIVCQANLAGRQAGKPGVTAGSVDQAARKVITEAGYGGYFIHRTGHGLGLDTHEEPYIYNENELLLQEGMTFTVEPGIYVPGKGGVRIEDDVVVTADGLETLTSMPRELRVLH